MSKELDKIGFVILCLAFILGLFFMACGSKQSETVEEETIYNDSAWIDDMWMEV